MYWEIFDKICVKHTVYDIIGIIAMEKIEQVELKILQFAVEGFKSIINYCDQFYRIR